METTNLNLEKKIFFTRQLTWKIILIGAITIMLLIPKVMIIALVDERGKTAESAKKEVMQKWSLDQVIRGPVLTIPYVEKSYNKSGDRPYETTKILYFLPEFLSIKGEINPMDRYRSIYRVVVYESEVTLEGEFRIPDFTALKIAPENLQWDKAEINISVSDLRGISNITELEWNQEKYTFSPGMDKSQIGSNGITLPLPLDPDDNFQAGFSCTLHLKGSNSIQFAPVGKITKVNLQSSWNDPGFTGNFLPAAHSVGPNGFDANWQVLYFNRNYPQAWENDKFSLADSDFGVELVTLADQYQKSTRSAKYGILVILLTFLSFFLCEIITKERIHPFQYALVGFAIVIFYLLLLSISEHMGFNAAYLISSVSVLLLVFSYSRSFLMKWINSAALTFILALAFGFIFILLQMESYALLSGSIGLFIILAATMYFTRKINWYDQ